MGKKKSKDSDLNDFERVFAYIIREAINEGRTNRDKLWGERLDVIFPPEENLNMVGYAKTLDDQDILVQSGYGSLDQIFVEQKRGVESARALSGLRNSFNRVSKDIGAHVQLYALGMPRRSCGITGGLITAFDVYNLVVDLTRMPQPTVISEKEDLGIGKPDFLYLNGANLALVSFGNFKQEDTLWTTFNALNRNYKELLKLPSKAYVEPVSQMLDLG